MEDQGYYEAMGAGAAYEAEASADSNARAQAEYEHEIAMQASSPMGVLEQFSTSKEGITLFASKVINEVEEGKADPLKVKLFCKTLTEIADKIDKATKSQQNTEAAKYGSKPFAFAGAELHLTSVHTSYDFTACGDPEWEQMNQQIESLKASIKQREEWLKTMGGPETIISTLTGEVVTIYPPIKKSTEGVKVSIKWTAHS